MLKQPTRPMSQKTLGTFKNVVELASVDLYLRFYPQISTDVINIIRNICIDNLLTTHVSKNRSRRLSVTSVVVSYLPHNAILQ